MGLVWSGSGPRTVCCNHPFCRLAAFHCRPEPDAGVYTAMAFAKPYKCEQLLATPPQQKNDPAAFGSLQHSGTSGVSWISHTSGTPSVSGTSSVSEHQKNESSSRERDIETGIRVRSWTAQEQWLTPQQFVQQVHSPPYDVLLGCDSWRACSNMVSLFSC